MSGFKNFVILGVGNIGSFVAGELLKEKDFGIVAEVRIFTRPITVVNAAHKAGVQLFVPSEFGNPRDGSTLAGLQEIGLPYVLFYTGLWYDFLSTRLRALNLDVASGKVSIAGDDNAPLRWTTRRDVARFIAYTFPRLPAAQLQNSFNEVFAQYRELSGKPLEVTYIPMEELEGEIAQSEGKLLETVYLKLK
ncbi:hypothetical protein FA95DRAFT_1575086 [Auriscalpium vulgare]|uniref:Uncharacterized protein n=1 Tax=Auriscalpium vulgare TaxID=40419 RepID=A0ACB8RIT0_9AGAM|nr:hypothetical protein FA95DRAFT_1575086 [Auriscalpium vulgare]